MINPTGGKIRSDPGYEHRGLDLECTPGQVVLSPISGWFVRIALPYGKASPFEGIEIHGPEGKIKMFHFQPDIELLGAYLEEGQPIGMAQDISEKHTSCGPHVHLQIIEYDPELILF